MKPRNIAIACGVAGVAAGVRDDQAYIDAVVAQVLPGVPAHVQAPQFACSALSP